MSKKIKKKLFISCPMKGRTDEAIKKSMEQMHKIAEVVFDQELEAIPSFIEENAPDGVNVPIWYLGKSLLLLAEADFFIGIQEWPTCWESCSVEKNVANGYGIPSTRVSIHNLMPDCVEIQKNYHKQEVKIYSK